MEVKHPTDPNYAPTLFYYSNDKIWIHNTAAGTFEHPTIQTNRAIKNHIRNMLDEGFEVKLSNP